MKLKQLLVPIALLGSLSSCGTIAIGNSDSVSNDPNVSQSGTAPLSSTISNNLLNSSSAGNTGPVSPEEYYRNLSTDKTGADFRKEIYDLMTRTHTTWTTYGGLSTAFKTTDKDPNDDSKVLLFYTGEFRAFTGSFQGSINREHVWPDSKGVGKADRSPGSDAHHLRPCDYDVNEARGNKGYGPGGYIPTDAYKGIAARIIFYVGAHYGPESTYKLNIVENVNGSSTSFGSLSVLLKWNRDFPVVESERVRNEAAKVIQGNRNPFIDHPEYACRIWGNDSAATKTACGL